MKFVPNATDDHPKRNQNEIYIHNVLFRVTLRIKYVHKMLHIVMTKEMG
jgi:hypothetical protein